METYMIFIYLNALIYFFIGNVEGIIGGDFAKIGQFKYQVSIQCLNKHICGGGIIHDQYILTAAHCIINKQNDFEKCPFSIIAAVINAADSSSSVLRIKVEKAYVPREYNRINPTPENPLYHETADIAVLKLQTALGLDNNEMLSKLNLPKNVKGFPTYNYEKSFIAGFGYESIVHVKNPESRTVIESSKLKFAKATVIPNEQCVNMFKQPISLNHLCAQMIQRQSNCYEGVCMGDSGSPLVFNGDTVIAVVSKCLPECSEKEKPAVYTRVSSYIPFIEEALNDVYSPRSRIVTYKK